MSRFPFAVLAAALLSAGHASAAELTVTMSGGTYQPAEISAAVGDTIRFVNDDSASHNVFVPTAGYALDLGPQEPGEEAVLTVRKPGVFEVECAFHPDMLMTVEVK